MHRFASSALAQASLFPMDYCRASLRSFAVASTLMLCATVAHAADSVLWVGNSRTYVGNLPEVYKALVKAADKRAIKADMLVEGGGSLEGRAQSHALQRELGKQKFDAVLLQERGNMVGCLLDRSEQNSADCKGSVSAFGNLARLSHESGAKVYLMGTHQETAAENRAINRAETITATRIKADGLIPMGMAYTMALKMQPDFKWVMPDDGYHPNRDLTLLMAVMSYYAIEKKWPAPVDVTLDYRAFDNSVGFGDSTLGSAQNTNVRKTHAVVPASHLADIIEIAKATMR
jgi:hypothetical protein